MQAAYKRTKKAGTILKIIRGSMKIIETERLILRTWQDSDLEPMHQINQDKEVMKYFFGLKDLEATEKLIENSKIIT